MASFHGRFLKCVLEICTRSRFKLSASQLNLLLLYQISYTVYTILILQESCNSSNGGGDRYNHVYLGKIV
jgi:hypothetical protein